MNSATECAARSANLCLLAGAVLLVPATRRRDWWREWRAELWQVRYEYAYGPGYSWHSERVILAFCLGAYQDALCLRRLDRDGRRAAHAPFALRFDSAWQCLFVLAILFGASFAFTRLLPGVCAERAMARKLMRPGLVLIKDVNNEDSPRTISAYQYRLWKSRPQRYFDGLAFYRVTREPVAWAPEPAVAHVRVGWRVARASSDFFSVLGLPVRLSTQGLYSGMPRVVLAEEVWKRQFGADPQIAGRVLELGSGYAVVAGVVPQGPWGLPGKVDAWLLVSDSQMALAATGYVIGHLSRSGRFLMGVPQISIKSFAPHSAPDDLVGIALGGVLPGAWDAFWFAILVAFLALPAVLPVSLHGASLSLHAVSPVRRVLCWSFFAAKIALLLAIAYCTAIDLAYGFIAIDSLKAIYIEMAVAFLIALAGLRWAIVDQRRRCPVCLRRVAHPARVGQFSRTFLAWNGTELVCMGGHTLLHVPALPTSWFAAPRWMFLDPSWKFLFAEPVRD